MSSFNQAAPPKKSRGRQKVTMAKMSNESNLQVTFSKRRAGLFKKASELCTLCGSEASIVVFSPANKVFCFGHPNVQTVIDKFEQFGFHPAPTTPVPSHKARSQLIMEAHRNSIIRDLNLELTHVESLLRAERRRAEELDLLRKSGQVEGWFFGGSLDGLTYDQLAVLKDSITGFKKNLDVKVQNDMFALANPPPPNNHLINYPPPPPPALAGNNNNFFDYWVNPATLNNNNNVQMSPAAGSIGFNPVNFVGFGDINIGPPYGAPAANYGTIDEALDVIGDPLMSSNNNNLQVPSDDYYYGNGGGNNNITGFGSYSDQGFNNNNNNNSNMAPFDPSLF